MPSADSSAAVASTPFDSSYSPGIDIPYDQEPLPLVQQQRASCYSRCAAFFRRNAVQRVLSAAVLAPAVTVFLWLSPAFATTTGCSFLTSTCSYEYTCLANRIRLRILTRLDAMERPRESEGRRCSSSSSRRLCYPIKDDASSSDSVVGDNEATSLSRRSSPWTTSVSSPTYLHGRELHDPFQDVQAESENQEMAAGSCEPEARLKCCAVTGLALKYFDGQEWVAAVWVAVFICAITSCVLLLLIQQIPELHRTEFYGYRWMFAIATGFVMGLSASFTPDWQYGVIMLINHVVFIFLTLHSTVCPINQRNCHITVGISYVFLIGFLTVLVFRFTSSRSSAEAFVNFMLDVLGLVYITGSLSILVSFVDDGIRNLYRKLLIALLYTVWASDTGAYLVGKTLAFFNYSYYHPLAAHLSKNKDYEGTLGAIVFGIAAMVVASNILDLPGSFGTKVAYTVIAVIAGRVGDLFESLLKRAAEVKDSGTLIPGHGGALDRVDALMFATVVFARYYAFHT